MTRRGQTRDLLRDREACLARLHYARIKYPEYSNAGGQSRTDDHCLMKALLYH